MMSAGAPIPEELWNTIPPAAQAAVAACVAELQARITAFEGLVRELQFRLNLNSTNSSKPPSSDPPYLKPAPPKTPSGKRKGGQPGHPKRSRPRLPPDEVVELRADSCRGCGTRLSGDDAHPLVHQVIEIPPPPKPHVTEYRRHRRCCPRCQRVTCAPLPAHAQSGYGPRVEATATLLSGAYRIGKRGVARLLRGLFGVPISPAMVCKLHARAARALDPVVRPIHAHLVGQPANVDETSWSEADQTAWLWTAVGPGVTAFLIRPRRTKQELGELIPGPKGVLTTDRLNLYDHLDKTRHQVCWAHLRRDFQAMIDRKDGGREIGEGLLDCANRLLGHWKRVRDGTLSREAFQTGPLVELVGEVNHWLGRSQSCGSPKTKAVCYALQPLGDPLWRFAWVEGVEPTNNAAERALRHGVFWRKMSAGTDTAGGSRFVERVLTVMETCRQQGRDLLSFLVDAIQAARTGSPAPSLIPNKTPRPQAA
jgi:transposase